MSPKRRRSEPKVFRCTGFGDCGMTFTRSEHLARHTRKHTGEKPFKCVVPNCDRMFSRFDNMMQHTQTHNRGKKKSLDEMVPPKDDLSNTEHQRMYLPSTENTSSYPYSAPLHPLSPPVEPVNYQPTPSPWHPIYPIHSQPMTPISSSCSESSYTTRFADFTSLPPNESFQKEATRKLSYADMFSSIESFSESSSDDDSDDDMSRHGQAGMYIGKNEYEALQGFSKFCNELKKDVAPSRPGNKAPSTRFQRITSVMAPESCLRSSF